MHYLFLQNGGGDYFWFMISFGHTSEQSIFYCFKKSNIQNSDILWRVEYSIAVNATNIELSAHVGKNMFAFTNTVKSFYVNSKF